MIKIVVADDHEVVRSGYAALLDTQPDFAVAGTAVDGAQAVALCRQHEPDVVLMDVRMPGMSGIDTTRRMAAALPSTRIIMLTVSDEEDDLFGAAVRAGHGWGMFPESLAAPALADGSFVRVSDAHLDVPLFWQCWKLDSPIVERVTNAVRSAAADLAINASG